MMRTLTVIPVGWRNKDAVHIPPDKCVSLSALKAAVQKALGPDAHDLVHVYAQLVHVRY